MPEKRKAMTTPYGSFEMPWGSLAWVVIGVIIFLIGTQVVTLRDEERFPADFLL